jgi:hypothetical protein
MQASIIPRDTNESVHVSAGADVYIVLDELSTQGRVWREVDAELANEAAVIEWIIEGQFEHPVCIVAFNTAEGWSKDVSENIALRLLELSRQGRVLGAAAIDFVERVTGQAVTVLV